MLIREGLYEERSNFSEIENVIINSTDNFSEESGVVRVTSKSEQQAAIDILRPHYQHVNGNDSNIDDSDEDAVDYKIYFDTPISTSDEDGLFEESYKETRMLEEDMIVESMEVDLSTPKDTLDVYLNWEGIMGYTDSIIEEYEDGGYEGLSDYLEEEGIYGYTDTIVEILEGGSAWCKDMDQEDYEDLCRQLYIDPEIDVEEALNEDDIQDSKYKRVFIKYCKDKIKDLGTVEVDKWHDGDYEDFRVVMIGNIRDKGECKVYVDDDEPEGFSFVGEDGTPYWTPMIETPYYAGRMEFTAISRDFYNEILEYWDDLDMDEVIADEISDVQESLSAKQ